MNLPPVPPLAPQPNLFDPPLPLPHWEMFPLQERLAALRLLIQLLRDHRPIPRDVGARGAPPSVARPRKAVADE
jgi:hypothetical protein